MKMNHSVSLFPSHQVDSQSRLSCSSVPRRVYSYLQLQLLLERPCLTYSLAVALLNIGYYVPYFHLVAHSRQAGFSEYEAAFVMSAAGFTDSFGRVALGWFADLGHFRLIHLLSFWTTLAGVFIILLPVSSLTGSYTALVLTSLLYGFCSGALTSLVFAVVPLIVGVDRVMEALGLLQLIESGAGLLGTPLSGRSTVTEQVEIVGRVGTWSKSCSVCCCSLIITVLYASHATSWCLDALLLMCPMFWYEYFLFSPASACEGLLKDITGNYIASFVVAGSFPILCTVIVATLPHFFSCTVPLSSERRSHDDKDKGLGSELEQINSLTSDTSHRGAECCDGK